MKRLLMLTIILNLLIGLSSADAINTRKGFNYVDESGLVVPDNVAFYFGTGSISAGILTADIKFLPDGTNLGITGAGAWDMSSGTGTFSLPTGTFTLTNGGTLAANKSLTWAAGSGGLDASSGTGTFKTSSGTNTHYGDTVITGAKTFTVGTGATVLGGTLDVDGDTTLDAVAIAETLDVDGNTDLDLLNVSEAAALASTLDVDGDTTLDAVAIAETLDVDGNTDLDLLNVSETLDVDGNTDLDLVNISETLDVDGATTVDGFTAGEGATFESTIDVTYAATDVTGTDNAAYIISMQLISNADAVSGGEDYILNDAVLNETENVYTVWANELTDDVPRALVADPDASFTGTITFYGTDMNDEEISEVLTYSSDGAQTTAAAFKDLTNITVSARTGGGDTTVDVGLGSRLGLNTKLTDAAQVAHTSVDNVLETTLPTVTVSATTLSLNTIDPNTANDGTKDVKVYMMV